MGDGISKERFEKLELVRNYRVAKRKIKKLREELEEHPSEEFRKKLERMKAKKARLKKKLEDEIQE